MKNNHTNGGEGSGILFIVVLLCREFFSFFAFVFVVDDVSGKYP